MATLCPESSIDGGKKLTDRILAVPLLNPQHPLLARRRSPTPSPSLRATEPDFGQASYPLSIGRAMPPPSAASPNRFAALAPPDTASPSTARKRKSKSRLTSNGSAAHPSPSPSPTPSRTPEPESAKAAAVNGSAHHSKGKQANGGMLHRSSRTGAGADEKLLDEDEVLEMGGEETVRRARRGSRRSASFGSYEKVANGHGMADLRNSIDTKKAAGLSPKDQKAMVLLVCLCTFHLCCTPSLVLTRNRPPCRPPTRYPGRPRFRLGPVSPPVPPLLFPNRPLLPRFLPLLAQAPLVTHRRRRLPSQVRPTEELDRAGPIHRRVDALVVGQQRLGLDEGRVLSRRRRVVICH